MKIRTWHPGMTDAEAKDVAYWERNMLALYYADGWYNDDVVHHGIDTLTGDPEHVTSTRLPRYPGWRRVLSLDGGRMTFHIPDDFDVGSLPEIAPNWDGHTTEEKWRAVLAARGIEVEVDDP